MTLHIILCVLLIFIILMQPGKGADVSSAFGGGSASQLFGAAGPGNFLTRGTGIIAGLFMVTSVTLVLYSTKGSGALEDLNNTPQEEEGSGFGNSKPPTPPSDGMAPTDFGGDAAGGAAPPAGNPGVVPPGAGGDAVPPAGGDAPAVQPVAPAPGGAAPAAPSTVPATPPAAPAAPPVAPASPPATPAPAPQ